MPTRRKNRPTVTPVTLATLTIPAKLDMMSGANRSGHFATEASTLDCYSQVRDEMIAAWPDTFRDFYAEKLYQLALANPDADVEKLGAKLRRAHPRISR